MNGLNNIKCLVLCGIAMVWFPDDDPVCIETHRNTQCDINISGTILCILLFKFCKLIIDNARNEEYQAVHNVAQNI
jgi:hypothetical protein